VFNNCRVINKGAKLEGGSGKDIEFHYDFSKRTTLPVTLLLIKPMTVSLMGRYQALWLIV
jgi:hypothetical protein